MKAQTSASSLAADAALLAQKLARAALSLLLMACSNSSERSAKLPSVTTW